MSTRRTLLLTGGALAGWRLAGGAGATFAFGAWATRAFATSAPGTPAAPAAAAAAGHAWLPQSRRIGQGTLRAFGFHVYDAALYALADFDAAAFAAHPLVLELRYQRALSGESISEYSLKEMRRLSMPRPAEGGGAPDEATAERWMAFMRRAFPDVRAGDRLTGQWLPSRATSRFAANDAAPVELQDAEFGPRFFGIWLSRQTPRPELREQLLGQQRSRG